MVEHKSVASFGQKRLFSDKRPKDTDAFIGRQLVESLIDRLLYSAKKQFKKLIELTFSLIANLTIGSIIFEIIDCASQKTLKFTVSYRHIS